MTGSAPTTLREALEARAREGSPPLVLHLEEGPASLDPARVLEEAHRGAAALAERGIGPGGRVGVLGPNRPEWVRWAFAAWVGGAAVIPLQIPVRLRSREAFAGQIRSLVRTARCDVVMTDPRLVFVDPERFVDWETAPVGPPGAEAPGVPAQDDLALIQFTSGSTADPKGVMVPHRTILHAGRMSRGSDGLVQGEDRLYTWLPFFHDYALLGYLLRGLCLGYETHVLPTERYAQDPASWFRGVTALRPARTDGPPSAWMTSLRAALAEPPGSIDLSSLRRSVLGAEPIDPATVEALWRDGAALGLRREALGTGYGLAEANLLVTATELGQPVRIDEVDADALATGRAEPAGGGPVRRVVGCGRPFPRVEVRIVGPEGAMAERRVGEIQVRSPAVMSGYTGTDDQDPFEDGWLRTGDLGYLAGGELFPTGREKDLIIVLGQNHAPQDLEWAAERVPGVRKGRAVAFGSGAQPGVRDDVVVVVEPARDVADPASLQAKVRASVTDATGLRPTEVLVVVPGTVPKTTSGKLRRSALRDAYARGELARPPGTPEAS
jgi:fatty-acyl-CoA synthase